MEHQPTVDNEGLRELLAGDEVLAHLNHRVYGDIAMAQTDIQNQLDAGLEAPTHTLVTGNDLMELSKQITRRSNRIRDFWEATDGNKTLCELMLNVDRLSNELKNRPWDKSLGPRLAAAEAALERYDVNPVAKEFTDGA